MANPQSSVESHTFSRFTDIDVNVDVSVEVDVADWTSTSIDVDVGVDVAHPCFLPVNWLNTVDTSFYSLSSLETCDFTRDQIDGGF
jgi:hypothetical protein